MGTTGSEQRLSARLSSRAQTDTEQQGFSLAKRTSQRPQSLTRSSGHEDSRYEGYKGYNKGYNKGYKGQSTGKTTGKVVVEKTTGNFLVETAETDVEKSQTEQSFEKSFSLEDQQAMGVLAQHFFDKGVRNSVDKINYYKEQLSIAEDALVAERDRRKEAEVEWTIENSQQISQAETRFAEEKDKLAKENYQLLSKMKDLSGDHEELKAIAAAAKEQYKTEIAEYAKKCKDVEDSIRILRDGEMNNGKLIDDLKAAVVKADSQVQQAISESAKKIEEAEQKNATDMKSIKKELELTKDSSDRYKMEFQSVTAKLKELGGIDYITKRLESHTELQQRLVDEQTLVTSNLYQISQQNRAIQDIIDQNRSVVADETMCTENSSVKLLDMSCAALRGTITKNIETFKALKETIVKLKADYKTELSDHERTYKRLNEANSDLEEANGRLASVKKDLELSEGKTQELKRQLLKSEQKGDEDE